ncbi:hypothetical protein B484DRAFT_422304 [Ochromonadaceae sp. CCMP2298]|nr:hypothetical protein B484DRAFT_422304 [Ochromonadaceae sp. CCMP2298]
MLAPGSCLSYRVAPGGALLFAQLSARRVDGSWTACPLVDHDTLDPALLPLSPNHDQTARLDSHIRIIPRLETCTDWTPVLVVNEHWFRAGYMFYRAGRAALLITEIVEGRQAQSECGDRTRLVEFTGSWWQGPWSWSPVQCSGARFEDCQRV